VLSALIDLFSERAIIKLMDKLLTSEQVAKQLGVCKESVWRYIRKGKLKAIKFTARNFRISEKDLNQFIKKHKTK